MPFSENSLKNEKYVSVDSIVNKAQVVPEEKDKEENKRMREDGERERERGALSWLENLCTLIFHVER